MEAASNRTTNSSLNLAQKSREPLFYKYNLNESQNHPQSPTLIQSPRASLTSLNKMDEFRNRQQPSSGPSNPGYNINESSHYSYINNEQSMSTALSLHPQASTNLSDNVNNDQASSENVAQQMTLSLSSQTIVASQAELPQSTLWFSESNEIVPWFPELDDIVPWYPESDIVPLIP